MSEINNTEKLISEIKKLFERTSKETLSEYLNNDSFIHKVNGCADCPFSRTTEVMNNDKEKIISHSYCLWDKNKGPIDDFMNHPNISPVDCPLNNKSIEIIKE